MFDQALLNRMRTSIASLAEKLPDGELNVQWLPRHLIYLEEFSKTSLIDNINHDILRLQHTANETVAFQLLDNIQNKIILLSHLARKYQTLVDNSKHAQETYRQEQADIFWVSGKDEKRLKLKLAKLKKALKTTQAALADISKDEDQTERIELLTREGYLTQQIELLGQKIHDRIDPIRQPQTYCVRKNPLAYTRFQAPTRMHRDEASHQKIQQLITQLISNH